MPEDRSVPTARASRVSQQTLILCFLFFGIVILFVRNIYLDQRADALAKNIASVRQDTQKQIAELRAAQTASLEQDLLRLDQLTSQVQKANEDMLRQSTLAADKTKAELAKTVEQRHQEMLRALSDIRLDLRATISAKPSPGPRDGQDATSQLDRPVTEVPLASRLVSNFSAAPALLPSEQEQPVETSGKKKQFWSKLNPFSRIKKKPATPANSSAQ
jgi:F0F1-type ATP synthase membrane subunit b/b'